MIDTGVGHHRIEDVLSLKRCGFERPSDVTSVGEPGEPAIKTPGIGPPVWGEETRERRDEIDVAVVLDRAGKASTSEASSNSRRCPEATAPASR